MEENAPNSFAIRTAQTVLTQGKIDPGSAGRGGVQGGQAGFVRSAPGGEFQKQAQLDSQDMDALLAIGERIMQPRMQEMQAEQFWNGVRRVSRGETVQQIANEEPWFSRIFGPTATLEGARAYGQVEAVSRSMQSMVDDMDRLREVSPEEFDAEMFSRFTSSLEGLDPESRMVTQQAFMREAPRLLQLHEAEFYKYGQERASTAQLNNWTALLDQQASMIRRGVQSGTLTEEAVQSMTNQLLGDLAPIEGQSTQSYTQNLFRLISSRASSGDARVFNALMSNDEVRASLTPDQLEALETQAPQINSAVSRAWMSRSENQAIMAGYQNALLTAQPEELIEIANGLNQRYRAETGSVVNLIDIGDVGAEAGQAIISQRQRARQLALRESTAVMRSQISAYARNYNAENMEDNTATRDALLAENERIYRMRVQYGDDPEAALGDYETNMTNINNRSLGNANTFARDEATLLRDERRDANATLAREQRAAAERAAREAERAQLIDTSIGNLLQPGNNSLEELNLNISNETDRYQALETAAQLIRDNNQENPFAVQDFITRLHFGSPDAQLPSAFLNNNLMVSDALRAATANGPTVQYNNVRPHLEYAASNPEYAAVLTKFWPGNTYQSLSQVYQEEAQNSPNQNLHDAFRRARETPRTGGIGMSISTTDLETFYSEADDGRYRLPSERSPATRLFAREVAQQAERLLSEGRAADSQTAIALAHLDVSQGWDISQAGIFAYELPPNGRRLSEITAGQTAIFPYNDEIMAEALLNELQASLNIPQGEGGQRLRELIQDLDPGSLGIQVLSEDGDETIYRVDLGLNFPEVGSRVVNIRRDRLRQTYINTYTENEGIPQRRRVERTYEPEVSPYATLR